MPALRVERDGEIAHLVIDRPDKRNAMSFEMWSAVPGLCAQIDADDGIRAVVVRGAGPHFCAGADIAEFATRRATAKDAGAYGEVVEAATNALVGLRAPSIASVSGFCIGGGCELAMACDLRFADTTARFAITPAKLGIVFNFVSTRRLVSLVGASFARYLLFSAETVPVTDALRVGLVDRVEEPEQLATATAGFATTVAARSRIAVQGSKRMIAKIVDGADVADDEAGAMPLEAIDSADYREGVRAFLEKRAPSFTD